MATKKEIFEIYQGFEVVGLLILSMLLMEKFSSIFAEVVSNNLPGSIIVLGMICLAIWLYLNKVRKSKK